MSALKWLYEQRNKNTIPDKFRGLSNFELHKIAVSGTDQEAYELYRYCANDGTGNDTNTGEPLKTFTQWLGE